MAENRLTACGLHRLKTGMLRLRQRSADFFCRHRVGWRNRHSSLGTGETPMLYAIFCYNDEDVVFSWSKEQDDAVMAKLDVVHQKLAKNGKLGPAVRLMPTTAATTIREDHEP